MKLVVLHSKLSGYHAACLRSLTEKYDVQILLIHWPVSPLAPFNTQIYSFIDSIVDKESITAYELKEIVFDYKPAGILMAGWTHKDYLSIAMAAKKNNIKVVAGSDSQWRNTVKQRIACLLSPILLRPSIDIMFVSGERQRFYANRLGYRGLNCVTGWYSCDTDQFSSLYENARTPGRYFLYVGRYIARKGVELLLQAYSQYRLKHSDPWDLVCVGEGPLKYQLDEKDGVRNLGFIQPQDLNRVVAGAGAFILPSSYEAWGVALHEAATAGLPVICSDAVGASAHLIREGVSGYIFESGSREQLTDAMERISRLDGPKYAAMSHMGHLLSKQFSTGMWADVVADQFGLVPRS